MKIEWLKNNYNYYERGKKIQKIENPNLQKFLNKKKNLKQKMENGPNNSKF